MIENSMTLVEGPWERVLQWIDERLGELWQLRGPYPGLGAALSAFGVQLGSFLAYELAAQLQGDEDPWSLVDHVFRNPTALPASMQGQVTSVLQAKWKDLHENKPERIELLKLLSRFELTADQAKRWYDPERRADAGIDVTDHEILQNPYLIFERDHMAVDPVSIWTIDRGVLPGASVLRSHPLPALSAMESNADVRRLRAIFVFLLYRAADRGHTLLPRAELIRQFRALNIDPSCDIDGDLLDAIQDQFAPDIHVCELKNGSAAYQLREFNEIGIFIRKTVKQRIKGKRHGLSVDWVQRLNEKLPGPVNDELESKAREEKAASLKELAESRISVLVGPAGTGKTTLLSVLCNEPSIRNDGVLLLAPTGKARVRLQQSTGFHAQTLAQFLRQWGRYDENTGFYYMSDHERYSGAKTVIIDEASMLTENQLAALLDALRGVQRLILVGDPRQLPPIGAGRPFVDIVNWLTPSDIATRQPKVGAGYAELTIRRRYRGETREDLQLAEWFSGRALGPGDDEVFNAALTRDESPHLRFVTWRDEAELHEQLLTVLSEELELSDRLDATGFELRLGGTVFGSYVYFNRGAAKHVEKWQILSPVRGMAHGVRDLNRFIQHTFRRRMIQSAKLPPWQRKIPSPMGAEGIVYGDKVINVLNHSRDRVYPNTSDALKYVANGEIGIVVGQFRNKGMTTAPTKLQVEFASQQGFMYDYTNRDFRDEGNPLLELAYAITVHKAQGSEFGICFLVLPQPCRTVTRELLYTALTRQQQKIVILIQGEPTDILKYSSDYFSDTARRLTNLFERPMPTAIGDVLLEDNLIHKSGKGEPMRSKSEVIIADALASAGIQYHYELPLRGTDGQIRYPDFTIEDDNRGITYYWEHCGMLYNPQYRERWERKLQWYRSQNILPIEEGGGERGTLIVTQDDENGGISSHEIKQLIQDIWG
ncbi:RNA helicase [Kyrpidia spormannii]|uniref:RNA helicase n=1 Tax=Kyrpidia spormannii TaxID=2055160 RepID=A0A2K8N2U4_9BACL|nr:AAA family ATPase [Kyrpidia spormannii]ATY83834.1 RNA helicase [Kyrpidia spormannii]